ncbi:MAG TPA: DUF3263 domain-containing protein [Acidimicrobiales bacterium]|nr:DUF3263 domain-containing protein [Acidimicrobiales bacterium]
MALTERDRLVLDVEREWWLKSPTKEQAIRARLGCSPAAYYAALRRLVTSPEAFSYDPLVIQRLRRRREERRRARLEPGPAMWHRPR